MNLRVGEQKTPEYLAINPAGSTPALMTDRGPLTQNLVIMGYVAQTYPDARLAATDDSFEFGRMQAFNGYLASSVHPAMGALLFAGLEGEAKETALKTTLGKLDLLETRLLQGPWAMGESYTVADGYLCVFTRWARQAHVLEPSRFPRLNDHLDRVQARPAVQRVFAAEGIEAA